MVQIINSKSDKLIKIQSELKAPKNQYNSFGKYNYRSAEDILEAAKPLLKTNNCQLVINEEVTDIAGHPAVKSIAIFHDGENEVFATGFAGVDVNRKGMDIAQSYGASSSYAKKYALGNLFLLDDTKDADSTAPKVQSLSLKQQFLELAKNSNDTKVIDAMKNADKWNDKQLASMIQKLKKGK